MRDIALSIVFAIALFKVFKNPEFGAYLWAWFSLMSPHRLTYGFAYGLPFAQLIALVTIGVAATTKLRQKLPLNSITFLWAGMLFWMTFTSFFAMNSQDLVVERWIFVFKIHLMAFISFVLIVKPEQLRILVIICTLSIAFYGIKGGLFTVLTGGSARVWGPGGSLLFGNNELAIGLVIVTPFLYWMREVLTRRWRLLLSLSILLCFVAILGSQSRGALLAVLAMGLFLGLKSKRPVQVTLGIGLLLLVGIAFMPDSWTQRMDTIGTYRQDSSAMERIWTWNTLWNVAVDRPLVGAGFRADARVVFGIYAPKDGEFEAMAGKIFVAHSIYFQMLGEHGFPGLILFLSLWAATWRKASKTAALAKTLDEFKTWVPLLMQMVQVSLMGYMIGGAFLSLAYLDVAFYLMGFVILAGKFVDQAVTGRSQVQIGSTTRGIAEPKHGAQP